MAESKRSIKLTSLDDLFSTEESRAEAEKERVQDIPIAEIDGFPDHPFHVDMDDAMSEMVESVKRFGVLSPAVARQMNYITNAEAGHGLMKIGNALVPFVNKFPKNTELYRRMTTKPGETELWG